MKGTKKKQGVKGNNRTVSDPQTSTSVTQDKASVSARQHFVHCYVIKSGKNTTESKVNVFCIWPLLFFLLCAVVPGLRTPDSDRPLPSSNASPCLPWVWPSMCPSVWRARIRRPPSTPTDPAAWLQQNPKQIQTNQLNMLTTNVLSICISHIYSSRCMVSILIFIYSNCPPSLSSWKWRDLIYLDTCMNCFCSIR